MALIFKTRTQSVQPETQINPSINDLLPFSEVKKARIIKPVAVIEVSPEMLAGDGILRTGHVLYLFGIGQPCLLRWVKDGFFPAPTGRNPRPFWDTGTIREFMAKPVYDFDRVNAAVRARNADNWAKREAKLRVTLSPSEFEEWLKEFASPEALTRREEKLRREVSLTVSRMKGSVTAKTNRHENAERLRRKHKP